MGSAGKKIYTVRELTEKIKALLEESYPFVWIQGEISNFRVPSSGHFYFTLKDEAAQISAVMFRGQNKNLKFLPEDGMQVTGFGRVSVYTPRGAYQIVLEYLEPAGIGALQAAFEQLKEKLAAEGLFDPAHKRPLPMLPRKISLITSSTGAVVHDMIRVMNRRFPNLHLEVIPVSVQGENTVSEVTAALGLLNERGDSDLAILARGGGSIEDLWPFNSEEMARAIFRSAVPVVSAVGHETDYTIADFVADLRAPTPSAAAELVVPVKEELLNRQARLVRQLAAAMQRLVNERRSRVRHLSERLVHPRRRLDDLRLRLDDLSERLSGAFQRTLRTQKERLQWRTHRLWRNSPEVLIQARRVRLYHLADQLAASARSRVQTQSYRLRALTAKLHALSPAGVLSRGYSIARRMPEGSVVTDAGSVCEGEVLEILLARGRLGCRVEERKTDGQEDI
jgi:exodeoxyribonuclease VII large subunit